jgi:glyoxylase-like metal-dependent hydrolase (beta-lactamase superfamily II)
MTDEIQPDSQPPTMETTEVPAARPIITSIPVGALAANCYLVTCPQTGATLIIDPGAEAERIVAQLAKQGAGRDARVVQVLHTHGHFDHISATEALLTLLGATPGSPGSLPLAAHPADQYLYEQELRAAGAAFGYPLPQTLALPDVALADGGVVKVGNLRLEVVHTPGHTPGSISLVCGDVCFSGDTLFRHGIGRTDLLGGDEELIYESIITRLYTLPPEATIYPGHGPATTIGEERAGNPFVRG